MFRAGCRFGRRSAQLGGFQELFGSSEPHLRGATFVHFALSMVRPPAAAIRDLLDFRGLGAKNAGKVNFFGLGARPTNKKNSDPKNMFFLIFVAVPTSLFSSKTE